MHFSAPKISVSTLICILFGASLASAAEPIVLLPRAAHVVSVPAAEASIAKYDLSVAVQAPAECVAGQNCAVSVVLEDLFAYPAEGPFYIALTSTNTGIVKAVTPATWHCEAGSNLWTCKSPKQILDQSAKTRLTAQFVIPSTVSSSDASVCARMVWMGSDSADATKTARLQILQSELKSNGQFTDIVDGAVSKNLNVAVYNFIQKYNLAAEGVQNGDMLGRALFGPNARLSGDANAANDSVCTKIQIKAMSAAIQPAVVAKVEAPKPAAPAAKPADIGKATAAAAATATALNALQPDFGASKPVAKPAIVAKVEAPKPAVVAKVEAPKPVAPAAKPADIGKATAAAAATATATALNALQPDFGASKPVAKPAVVAKVEAPKPVAPAAKPADIGKATAAAAATATALNALQPDFGASKPAAKPAVVAKVEAPKPVAPAPKVVAKVEAPKPAAPAAKPADIGKATAAAAATATALNALQPDFGASKPVAKPAVVAKVEAPKPVAPAPKVVAKVEAPKPAAPAAKPADIGKATAAAAATATALNALQPDFGAATPVIQMAMLLPAPEPKFAKPLSNSSSVYDVKLEGEPKDVYYISYNITSAYGVSGRQSESSSAATRDLESVRIIRGNQKPMPQFLRQGVDFNPVYVQGLTPESSYTVLVPTNNGVLGNNNQNALVPVYPNTIKPFLGFQYQNGERTAPRILKIQ